MCGRFSLDRYPESIVTALMDAEIEFMPRAEVHPADQVDVVFQGETGNELASMKWGWERSFAKRPLINARSAEAWDRKTWAQAMRTHRCIVPASGFFEWDENQPKGHRDKYRVEPAEEDGFAFGGLYEISPVGGRYLSILTTGANSKMARIHHRMPVILQAYEFEDWFSSMDRLQLEHMMQPVPAERIRLVRERVASREG